MVMSRLRCEEASAQGWVQQQRSTVGHTGGKIGWRGNDWIKRMAQQKPREEDVIRSLLESMKQGVVKKSEPNGSGRPRNKGTCLPLIFGTSYTGRPDSGRPLEIKGDCKNDCGLGIGHAKMKTRVSTVEAIQNLLREWWGRGFVCDSEPPSCHTHLS